MDISLLATSFSSVVGLVCNYRAVRQESSTESYQEFLAWLESANHQEIKALVEQNSGISVGIKALLNMKFDDFARRFDKLDELMVSVASRIDGFSGLAGASPRGGLSSQAVSILRQLYDSNSRAFIVVSHLNGVELPYSDVPGSVEFTEFRFLDDDLLMLSELGLLRMDTNSRGLRVFSITRNAERFLSLV